MGRTKRIRSRKKLNTTELDFTSEVESLMSWMRILNWRNTSKICCRPFESTGRGISSIKRVCSKDILITVPFKLLITYSTVTSSEEFMKLFKLQAKLRIHDLLASFLVLENHKRDQSFWKYYLKSLPSVVPNLPWLLSYEEIQYFPEELRKKCEKCRSNFEDSWKRLQESLLTSRNCLCCEKKVEEIFNLESYTWGYIMVNTRGVFVDPELTKTFSKSDIIDDEPQIAMIPLLDMFNHSDVAENQIEFQETPQGLFYQLSTLNNYKKNDQIFISYGRHDNTTLFSEYGFYLPKNSNDKIKFLPSEIMDCLNLKLDNFQFEFLKKHQFLDYKELFISLIGPSFKLKGFLYVTLNKNVRNYSAYIFSENYSETFLQSLQNCGTKLLIMKIKEYKCDYWKFKNKFGANNDVSLFLEKRVEFVELIKKELF